MHQPMATTDVQNMGNHLHPENLTSFAVRLFPVVNNIFCAKTVKNKDLGLALGLAVTVMHT